MDFNKICPHCMNQITEGSICSYCKKDPKQLPPPGHQLRPFSILQGKYLIGGVLGEGGFGITYKGMDINLQMPVAVKEFYPNGFVTREAAVTSALTVYSNVDAEAVAKWRENFLGEARCLARCTNLPGVVGVKDFFQENNTVYIVLEYLEGKTLKEHLKAKGGRIPADELIRNMEPVIKALHEVHKQGLIHRDISPDNIMLLNNGTMKVLDFGAARSFVEDNEKSKSILLKHGYAPEEQYRTRGKQGPWTDVYALCATMYKCITGVTPLEAMDRLRQDEMKWPSDMGIAIDVNFENVLKKGMAVYAENRFQDMQQLYDALYSGAVVQNQTMAQQTQYQTVAQQTQYQTGAQQTQYQTVAQQTQYQTVAQQTQYQTGAQQTQYQAGAQQTPQPSGTTKIKPAVIVAIGAFLCICIVLFAVVLGSTGKKDKEVVNNKKTESVSKAEENTEEKQEVSVNVPKADMEKMELLLSEMQAREDITSVGDILEQAGGIFAQYESNEEVQAISKEIYAVYLDKMTEYIEMIKSIEEFNIAHYQECSIRFDELEYWNGALKCGYDELLASDRELCKKEYKNKYVKRFDEECVKTWNENGVISRTVAWGVLEGVDNTDLYNANSNGDIDYRYDSLRLRYIVAKVYKLHKDITNMSVDEAINAIKNAMVECDYDPMLVYLLAINGYEPAYAWLEEIEFILSSTVGLQGYTAAEDNERLNFVYIYNTTPQEYEECKNKIIKYMQDYYY